MNRPAGQ